MVLPPPRYKVTLREVMERGVSKHYYDVIHSYRSVTCNAPSDEIIEKHTFGGTTAITGIIGGGKTRALMGWAVKVACGYMEEWLKSHTVQLYQAGKGATVGPEGVEQIHFNATEMPSLIKAAKKQPKKELDSAASLGTKLHKAIERHLKGEKQRIPKVIRPTFDKFLKWFKDRDWEFISPEVSVASLKHRYGGQFDAVVRRVLHTGSVMGTQTMANEIMLIDWKSSGGIYKDYALQIAGYAQAFEETYGIKADRLLIVRFPKDGAETEMHEVIDNEAAYQAFLNAKGLKDALDTKLLRKVK